MSAPPAYPGTTIAIMPLWDKRLIRCRATDSTSWCANGFPGESGCDIVKSWGSRRNPPARNYPNWYPIGKNADYYQAKQMGSYWGGRA